MLSLLIAGLSGCFYYPAYYEPAPGYVYVPGAGPAVPVVPELAVPAQPQAAFPAPQYQVPPPPPPPPSTPSQSRGIVAHETRLRELQQKRDEAQKDLDAYVSEYNRERAAALASPPPPPVYPQPQAPAYQQPQAPAYPQPQAPNYQQPQTLQRAPAYPQPQSYRSPPTLQPARKLRVRQPLTSIGVDFGGRALDYEIAGVSALGKFGVHLSHRLADTSLVIDLGFARAGFVEPEGPSDRSFSSLEGSIGVRFMGSQEERSTRHGGGAVWYVGVGAMGLEIIDQYVDSYSGEVLSEETASASGSYASAGIHFTGRSFGSGDLELRQIMNTDYSTYGVGKSSDGLEALVRLSLTF